MDASQIAEHMEVAGADGEHVGTVDGVEGERIKLTRTDENAGSEHHYLPLTAVSQVTDVVTLTESAENAKANWTTE